MSRYERNPIYVDSDNPVVIDLAKRRAEREVKENKSKLRLLTQIGAVGAGVSLVILAAWATKQEYFENPTTEQKNAENLLSQLPESDKVHNLVVGVDGVNLRDKPNTDGAIIGKAGEIEDYLEPGTVIESAGVTLGNDDDIPWDRNRQDKWVFFENPKKDGEVLFANSELFDPSLELELAPVIELDK